VETLQDVGREMESVAGSSESRPMIGTAKSEETGEKRVVAGEGRALTWDELSSMVSNVLNVDYENGPCIAQSRLRLFGRSVDEAARVTLYRDNHAWCPYCQKVWMWLEEMKVPYRVEKVALLCYGTKENWYKEIVPSGMVPALALDGVVITDSDRIIERLEGTFGVVYKSINDPAVNSMRKLQEGLHKSWLTWLCEPDRSVTEGNTRKRRCVEMLEVLEKILEEHSGNYIGKDFTVIDVLFAPFLERINATLYYYKGFTLRYNDKFPNITAWFDAMETRESYRGTLSDFHTHCHVVPALFGVCYESGDAKQQECRAHVDDGPFLTVPDTGLTAPPDSAEVALARVIKHKNSVMKQNPHRHGNIEEAFRGALTFMITGDSVIPPEGTHSSLRYIRDRICVPRDMPSHSAEILRHALEETAKLIGKENGTPIPVKHRRDQEPFAFIKAKQNVF